MNGLIIHWNSTLSQNRFKAENHISSDNFLSSGGNSMDMDWKVELEKDRSGWYTVTVPALPGCISQGKTRQEALKNIKEAISLHLESLAESGIPIYGKKETTTVSVSI